MENWQAYSWVPNNRVPGGREKLVVAVVPAASRKEAIEAFLAKHPEEKGKTIAASRAKDGAASPSKQTTKRTRKMALTFSGHTGVTRPSSAARRHPLYKKTLDAIRTAEDENSTMQQRHEAMSYVRVMGLPFNESNQTSREFSEFAKSEYLRLRNGASAG